MSVPPKDAKVGTVSPIYCTGGSIIHAVGRGRPTGYLPSTGISVEVHKKTSVLFVYVYIRRSDVVTSSKDSPVAM